MYTHTQCSDLACGGQSRSRPNLNTSQTSVQPGRQHWLPDSGQVASPTRTGGASLSYACVQAVAGAGKHFEGVAADTVLLYATCVISPNIDTAIHGSGEIQGSQHLQGDKVHFPVGDIAIVGLSTSN